MKLRKTPSGNILGRYRVEDGTVCIDIHLVTSRQLFNELDPAPFPERDLDGNAVEYIQSSFGDVPLATTAKLVIHLSQETLSESQRKAVEDAIHGYFAYEARFEEKKLKETLHQGRISFAIGLIFLFTCITLSTFFISTDENLFSPLIREGLAIIGWVAMWKPINIFLYDWWPLVGKCRLNRKISASKIEFRERAST